MKNGFSVEDNPYPFICCELGKLHYQEKELILANRTTEVSLKALLYTNHQY